MSKSPPGFADDHTEFVTEVPAVIDPPRFLSSAELAAIARKTDAWLEANEVLVGAMPVGTIIKINVSSGEYVSGLSEDDVDQEFSRRFERGTVSSIHRVGRSITVGGGWWALHKGP